MILILEPPFIRTPTPAVKDIPSNSSTSLQSLASTENVFHIPRCKVLHKIQYLIPVLVLNTGAPSDCIIPIYHRHLSTPLVPPCSAKLQSSILYQLDQAVASMTVSIFDCSLVESLQWRLLLRPQLNSNLLYLLSFIQFRIQYTQPVHLQSTSNFGHPNSADRDTHPHSFSSEPSIMSIQAPIQL